MEVYPENMDGTNHIYRPFFRVYLHQPKNYYSHSLNNLFHDTL